VSTTCTCTCALLCSAVLCFQVDWERWLAFRQPAVGAMCWGNSCVRDPRRVWHASSCHSDHKIVAYHREALETLLPMTTHRDHDCWWAGQVTPSPSSPSDPPSL
jgi:hypothetical protein